MLTTAAVQYTVCIYNGNLTADVRLWQDASWLLPSRSLKCTSAEEVFLLLKSSDSIVHDLCHAYVQMLLGCLPAC